MINVRKVKSRMRELKMQSKDLAAKAGISEVMMCYVLQGTRTPSLPVAVNIADALGLKVDEIVKHN